MDHFTLILFRFPDDARVVVADGLGARTTCSLAEAVSRHQIFRSGDGFDYALRTRGWWAYLGLRVSLLEFKIGPWSVSYDPPPIPSRTADWRAVHKDYDASWEGEEGGWVSNGLSVVGPSPDAVLREIDDLEADGNMPRTLEAA